MVITESMDEPAAAWLFFQDGVQRQPKEDNIKLCKLLKVCADNPVLNLIMAHENLANNDRLYQFLESRLNKNEDFTMTAFAASYVNSRIPVNYTAKHVKGPLILSIYESEQLLDILGYLALQEEFLDGGCIKREHLINIFRPYHDMTDEQLQQYHMGFLVSETDNNTLYFKERFVQRYLIARYQYRLILHSARSSLGNQS